MADVEKPPFATDECYGVMFIHPAMANQGSAWRSWSTGHPSPEIAEAVVTLGQARYPDAPFAIFKTTTVREWIT